MTRELVPVPLPSPLQVNLDSNDHWLDRADLIERAVRECYEARLNEELARGGFPGLHALSRNPDGTYLRSDLQASWRAFRRGFYIGALWAEGAR